MAKRVASKVVRTVSTKLQALYTMLDDARQTITPVKFVPERFFFARHEVMHIGRDCRKQCTLARRIIFCQLRCIDTQCGDGTNVELTDTPRWQEIDMRSYESKQAWARYDAAWEAWRVASLHHTEDIPQSILDEIDAARNALPRS